MQTGLLIEDVSQIERSADGRSPGLRHVWCCGTYSFAQVFIPVGMTESSRR
ncbi:hypothetical protein RISK_003526 [Rhodopirellula islandica]|uniref:Uncharacterized protein n=1 Tax=Rhodopirellula islandica TaxID=595434 RepID=A0A0J1BCZ0_RHOIS|nr:hypothetical protein RISK_003526 [Rhodopirellula islandica]